MYQDVDPLMASIAAGALVKQSAATFTGISEYSTFDAKIPQIYVICENDRSVHPEIQEGMAELSRSKVVRLPCGHTPFLKEKETEALLDIIKSF
jgi:deoxyxylulose-5-phosphate synthase